MALEAMARAATQKMTVLDACVEKDRPVVTARHEVATKAADIDVRKVRRVAAMGHHRVTVLAVNAGLAPTVRHIRRDLVPISHIRPARQTEMQIRKKAPKSPPPFDLSS